MSYNKISSHFESVKWNKIVKKRLTTLCLAQFSSLDLSNFRPTQMVLRTLINEFYFLHRIFNYFNLNFFRNWRLYLICGVFALAWGYNIGISESDRLQCVFNKIWLWHDVFVCRLFPAFSRRAFANEKFRRSYSSMKNVNNREVFQVNRPIEILLLK